MTTNNTDVTNTTVIGSTTGTTANTTVNTNTGATTTGATTSTTAGTGTTTLGTTVWSHHWYYCLVPLLVLLLFGPFTGIIAGGYYYATFATAITTVVSCYQLPLLKTIFEKFLAVVTVFFSYTFCFPPKPVADSGNSCH